MGVLRICPNCNFVGDELQDFNVIGACDGNIFCTRCHTEIDEEGNIHKCNDQCTIEGRPRKFVFEEIEDLKIEVIE